MEKNGSSSAIYKDLGSRLNYMKQSMKDELFMIQQFVFYPEDSKTIFKQFLTLSNFNCVFIGQILHQRKKKTARHM